ncbi:MAG: flippase activity-associated protein Agl23 [Chthoniobacteraceae bacterium]|jgi:uncharacterized protein (TIGR03663 family)
MDFKAKLKQDWPVALIVAVAAVARLARLSMKPPHFDEGVNGWFVDQMMQHGYYHYDPTNYHGPFHFYVLFLAQALLGRHIWALRLPLTLLSLAAVIFTLRFDRFIGRKAALWAAAAMAVSPGCVFYGRYAIHEYWLVFALMLCAWGLAGLWKFGEPKYLWALWVGLTLAVLTKETYIIHFGCAILAIACAWLLGRISPAAETGPTGPTAPQKWTWRQMALGALLFVGLIIFFYSGTFMDWKGLKGLYLTFSAWAKTGSTGNGHEKAWYYWLKLFGLYEWPSCIGLLVALLCMLPRTPRFIRALSIYACGALAAYSIIHYKTPWCIVSLTWPFLLLFGYGVDLATQKFGKYAAAIANVIAATVLAVNLCDMVRLNYRRYTDAREPYVYVQTFNDVNKLMKPLDALIARNPANYQLIGNIVLDSYHPLPWLLGDFPNIGYYNDDDTPTTMDADFLIVEESRIDEVEAGLHDRYFTEDFTLRDAQDPSMLFFSVKKFRSLFPGRKPGFVPKPAPKPSPTIPPLPSHSPPSSPSSPSPSPIGRPSQ